MEKGWLAGSLSNGDSDLPIHDCLELRWLYLALAVRRLKYAVGVIWSKSDRLLSSTDFHYLYYWGTSTLSGAILKESDFDLILLWDCSRRYGLVSNNHILKGVQGNNYKPKTVSNRSGAGNTLRLVCSFCDKLFTVFSPHSIELLSRSYLDSSHSPFPRPHKSQHPNSPRLSHFSASTG